MFKRLANWYIRRKTKNLTRIPLFTMTFDYRKYKEKNTECDICEYREKCAKYSSGIDCTTSGDTKTHIIYPQDKCVKRGYDCTGLNNKLEHIQIDIGQIIEKLKKTKGC